MAKIRVMIIDDSLMFREFLSRSLSQTPALEIVGAFGDPVEAMAHIEPLRPDVLSVDMEMPKMRGNEFLRQALSKYPHLKAVMVSSLSGNVFDAMQAGAIDFVRKPVSRNADDQEQFINDLVQKIKIAAVVTTKAAPELPRKKILAAHTAGATLGRANLQGVTSRSIIAIGASTGGTEAILEVVKHLPTTAPGVVIVQHMPPGFTQMYAERADTICEIAVREAKHGDRLERGLALIAPGGDQHMRVRQDGNGYIVTLNNGPKVSGHCPSVDVLFESVAQAAGPNAMGIILTGMGGDGAKKLCEMRRAGAYTIGQDPDSCVVYGMPKVAYDLGGVTKQLPVSAIGEAILRHFSK